MKLLHKIAYTGQTEPVLGNLGRWGCTKGQLLKECNTLPFWTRPNLTMSPTIISCYVSPHKNLYLIMSLHQLMNKNTVELVKNQKSLGFYKTLFGAKTKQPMEVMVDLCNLKKMPQGIEGPLSRQGVSYVQRLQGCLFPYTHSEPVQKIAQVSPPGSDLSVQSSTFWSVHSTHGVHYSDQ